MSVNIFGFRSTIKRQSVDNSKFITLTKAMQTKVDKAGDKMTGNLDMNNNRLINIGNPVDNQDCVTKDYSDSITKSINRSVQLKVNADGDIMRGGLNMDWNSVKNVKFPLNSCDATNKLYVQICTESDEIDVEKLCKLGEIISLILVDRYESLIQNMKRFLSSLAYAISMYSKYKNVSLYHAGNIKEISNCTIFVDLKVNIAKIIEVLPQKNLLLLDIGFVYLIDSLLHILLLQ